MAPPVRAPGPVSALGGLPRSPGVVVAQAPSLVTPPSVVSGITIIDPPDLAVSMSGLDATLTWSASQSENVSDYDVYRRSPATGVPFVVGVDTPIASAVTSPYVDSGLTAGDYEWEVFGNIAPWTPAAMSPVGWFKGDVGVTDAGGGAVSTWANQGSGGNASQGTGSNRPTTGTRSINSINAVDFDGTDDFLTATLGTLTQPVSVFIVAIFDTTAQSVFYDGNNSGGRCLVWYDVNYHMYAGSVIDTGIAGATGTHQQVHLYNGNSSASKIYTDGSLTTSTSPGTGSLIDLTIGWDQPRTASYSFDGAIAELVIVDGLASADDLTNWNAYTLARFGV